MLGGAPIIPNFRSSQCFEEQAEYDALMNAALVGASHEEAQRFVSTLFETRPLYDSSDVSTYCQSAEYEALNRPRGFIIKKVEEKVPNICFNEAMSIGRQNVS